MKVVIIMKNLLAIGLGLLGVFAVGCSSATVVPPSDFAVVDGGDYEVRASSADGVVIAVRENPNDMKGNLAFWTSVVSSKLQRSGYTRDDSASVITRAGLAGQEIRFSTTRDGRAHRYWVSVFVTNDRVFLVEAGGDAELFDAKTEQRIRESITSFDAG